MPFGCLRAGFPSTVFLPRRDAQLDMANLLIASRASMSSLLYFRGPKGLGKSTMLERVTDMARCLNYKVAEVCEWVGVRHDPPPDPFIDHLVKILWPGRLHQLNFQIADIRVLSRLFFFGRHTQMPPKGQRQVEVLPLAPFVHGSNSCVRWMAPFRCKRT